MEDQYIGCILGLAIGDALGHPVEFLKSSQIRARFGPQGVTDFVAKDHHPPGTYTDDTQMTVALAEALLTAGSGDDDTLMAEVARRFVEWEKSPDNDRAPGMTCLGACEKLARGVPWRETGRNFSKGCGTAMRAAPVGLLYHSDPERIRHVGSITSQITHGHHCATAGSVGAAYLVSLALDRVPPQDMIDPLCELTAPISADFVAKIRQVPTVLDRDPEEAFAVLGEGWVAEEAVAAALYCCLRTPEDYRASVLAAANASGDCDSIACIAGAISGAYHGTAGIPADWIRRVEKTEYLQDLGRRLYRAAQDRAA